MKHISELEDGDYIKAYFHRCRCGTAFVGRRDARFCSDRCRQADRRARSAQGGAEASAATRM